MGSLKVISWNVNGIRACYGKGFLDYLSQSSPDFMCLQEVRASKEQIPAEIMNFPDYPFQFYVQAEKKGYSGSGILSKIEPKAVFTEIGIEEFDREGRVAGIHVGDILLFSVYFPNGSGKDQSNDRVPYKLAFYDAFFAFCEQLRREVCPNIIVCGDYNTAQDDIDLARPKENVNTSGFLPEEREKFRNILDLGYFDAFRTSDPNGGNFTWWSNRQQARARNIGWRIDYHLCSTELGERFQKAWIEPHILGSDHCPIGLLLAQ